MARLLIGAIVVALLVLSQTVFVVGERQQALITQFGKPVRTIREPGLYVKVPVVQTLSRFERRILATDVQAAEYLTLKDLAAYCAIGMRRLRDHLTDPGHPLPHFRVGGKILIRRSDFESWLIAYRRAGAPDVERIVHEVVSAVAP